MNRPSFLNPLRRAMLGFVTLLASAVTSLQAQRITVTEPNTSPVSVETAAISTEVTGRIAVTTFDLVFRNPNNRVLEGSFEFPLLDGQSVVSFGLDLNGKIRTAVPVEKNRGRVVFEEIVRRGVDPALLEQTVGNNYRARIYPIPAHGTRRVVISYQEDLAHRSAGPVYRLALDFPTPLKSFRLAVNVESGDAALAKATTTLPIELPAWREEKMLVVERTHFSARGVFEVELPPSEHPQVLTERRNGQEYFYAEVPVTLAPPETRPLPTKIGLLWDASGSGRERDHAGELALLDAWFAAVPEVEVKLIAFRDHAAAPLSFKIHHGNWDELRSALTTLVYDGATSFDGLTDDPTVGEWIMFSDGLVNFGVTQATTKLPLRAPVHTVLASPHANAARLRGLAQRQAGEFVNLLVTAPKDAALRLREESWHILGIEHNPEQVAQLFPDLNTPVNESPIIVTGILKTPVASLRLLLGHHAADAQKINLTVRTGQNPSGLAARAWATTKITSLATDPTTNRADSRRTSQEFGIVSSDTSLIVLETLQDYLRYDITPPEELRADWETYHRGTAENRRKGQDQQLTRVAELFAEKTSWWESKFIKNARAVSAPMTVSHATSASAPRASAPNPESTNHTSSAQPSAARVALPESLDDEVIVLSPFMVEASTDNGYRASNTLAGTRLRTELSDIGSSISVVTNQSMNDTRTTHNSATQTDTATTDTEGTNGNVSGHSLEESAGESEGSPITLQHWEADAGYLDRLRKAAPETRYSIYREERSAHLSQPGFYLDVADFFFKVDEPELAHRILSNLAELQLDDPALLRVLAHRLVQADRPDLAQPLFERVLTLRPEEPQSRRDLALVCSALKQNQRAVDLLWEIVTQAWDGRFPEIELIALGELNAIVATCGEKLDLSQIDRRFLKNLSAGLRVILTWDADACDIDLWVDDPIGEQAIYSHPRTIQGGRMSRDFTGGYGPEEFLLRDPMPGKYSIRINYYGDRRQTALGPVTAQIRLITGFGTAAEKEQRLTVQLSEKQETLEVGTIQIGK